MRFSPGSGWSVLKVMSCVGQGQGDSELGSSMREVSEGQLWGYWYSLRYGCGSHAVEASVCLHVGHQQHLRMVRRQREGAHTDAPRQLRPNRPALIALFKDVTWKTSNRVR